VTAILSDIGGRRVFDGQRLPSPDLRVTMLDLRADEKRRVDLRGCASAGCFGLDGEPGVAPQQRWSGLSDEAGAAVVGGALAGRCPGAFGVGAGRRTTVAAASVGRGVIPGRVDISQRPAVAESKERVGDWELDTIIGARRRGPGVPGAGFGAGAHVDGGQRQGVRGPPGGGRGAVGGFFLRPALPLLGARAERAHQRPGPAVFPQGDGVHRSGRRPGPAGAGPAQRPSAPGIGLPHAGGGVRRGLGGGGRAQGLPRLRGAGGA